MFKEFSFNKVLEEEVIFLFKVKGNSSDFNDLLPMSGHYRGFLEVNNYGKDILEIVDFLFEFLVGLPFLEIFGKSDTHFSVFLDLFEDFIQLVGIDISPGSFFPLSN